MRIVKLWVATIALSVVAAAAPSLAKAQVAADTAILREHVKTYQAAWNTHDPRAVAAFFSEDADMVFGNLPASVGRDAIEGFWRSYFDRQEPQRRATFEVTSARLLTPNVALVNLTSTTGGAADGGEALQVRKARGTWLLRRHGDGWLIEAMRALPTEEDRVELMPSLETAKAVRPNIRALVAAYEDVFNRHDPDALSAFYREDADLIVREGPIIHGAQEIRRWWRAYFSQPQPYRALLIIENIRMMSDDVAVLNVIGSGATLEATDRLLPARAARATWVVRREDGKWLVAALWVLPSEDDRVLRVSSR